LNLRFSVRVRLPLLLKTKSKNYEKF